MSNSIKDLIQELSKKPSNDYNVVCTISSVDTVKNTCYCKPVNGDADLFDVRLIADNKKGFLLTPKVDSVVIVSFLNNELPFISMFSEIDEIQLNGKNYDGLVKINDLVTKMNNLENKVNSIITSFNSHVHTGGTISGSTGPGSPPIVGTLTPTQKTDLENTKVLQGNGS